MKLSNKYWSFADIGPANLVTRRSLLPLVCAKSGKEWARLNRRKSTWKVEDIKPSELNRHLCEFILSVRRKDGEDYTNHQAFKGSMRSFQALTGFWKPKHYIFSCIWMFFQIFVFSLALISSDYFESFTPSVTSKSTGR